MKKALSIATPVGAFLTLVPSVFAATINACVSAGQFDTLCGFGFDSFGTLIGTLINLMFVIAVIAALFYLVLGGFRWLTSGGDKQAVGQARDHIIAAIIGLVVIFLSYFILNILIGFFVPNVTLSTLKIPSI